MDARALLRMFRSEVDDVAEPYLWEDTEIYTFIDEAQSKFCRLTGGLGDASTVSVTELELTAGTDWVDISALILEIKDAYRTADGTPIRIINREDMATLGIRFNGTTGTVSALIIGMEPHRARAYPVPSADDTLQLIVDRLPLLAVTESQLAFEIDEQHHVNLLKWVKHRAYSKQDSMARDDKKSADNEEMFRSYCAAAKAEKNRAKQKVRTVAYGGIPMCGATRSTY